MTWLKRASSSLLCALTCLGVAGCGGGEKRVTVTGKVHQGGKPIVIEDYYEGTECLQVEFFRLDAEGNLDKETPIFSQDVAEDGTFEILGPDRDGIPVGTYRVAVSRLTQGGEDDEEGDMWAGKFAPQSSPFEFEVTGQPIDIDLAKAQE